MKPKPNPKPTFSPGDHARLNRYIYNIMPETKALYSVSLDASYFPWSCEHCGRLLGYEHVEPVTRARANGQVVTHHWHVLRLVDFLGEITRTRLVGTGDVECGGCGEVRVWEWHR